ncbi:MAG: hypothetical protein MUE46_13940 [Xanthomonadales bacterium]|jgi:hypothetical protein|nr:hypothetical protein [Xanthomonadales bacterium]
MGRFPAIELFLCAFAGSLLAAERTACVPGEEGRWICGDAARMQDRPVRPATPPPAAPLPPVLLIDPDRLFGPAPARTSASSTTAEPAQPGSAAEPMAARTAPARPEPAPVTPTTLRRGSHVWQLARAGNPAGFAALLRQRGVAAAEVRTLQTRRGDWLLLYGDFSGIEAARAARTRAGAGFARAWAEVESEL